MSAAFYNPKKARRDARREAEALPSRPCVRFLADDSAPLYDPQGEVSAFALNVPALAAKIDFSRLGRMTRAQAHAVVSAMDDATAAAKRLYHAAIDAPTDAATDAKNGEEADA